MGLLDLMGVQHTKKRWENLGRPFGSDPASHAKRRTLETRNENIDWNAIVEKEAAANDRRLAEQTRANRPNINTPFGFQNWSQDASGNWTLNSGLAPGLQGHFDKLSAEFGQMAGTPFDFNMGRQEAEDALYQRQMMRLNPEYQTRESQLQAQLGAQGLDPTSSAYRAANRDLAAERVGAAEAARLNAIAGGGAEAARNFGMQLQARQLPLQQMGQLFGFTQTPEFSRAGLGQGPDYMGAARMQYGNTADQLARMEQEWANNTNAAFNLGGAVLGGAGSLIGGFGGFGGGAVDAAAPAAGNAMAGYRSPIKRPNPRGY